MKPILVSLCLFRDHEKGINSIYVDGLKLWLKKFPSVFGKDDKLVIYLENDIMEEFGEFIKGVVGKPKWLIIRSLGIQQRIYTSGSIVYFKMMFRWQVLWDYKSSGYVIASRDIDSWPTSGDYDLISSFRNNKERKYYTYHCEGGYFLGGGSIFTEYKLRYTTLENALVSYLENKYYTGGGDIIRSEDELFLSDIMVDVRENMTDEPLHLKANGVKKEHGYWQGDTFILPFLNTSNHDLY